MNTGSDIRYSIEQIKEKGMLTRFVVFLVVAIGLFTVAVSSSVGQDGAADESGYVQVNGLDMYYEVHGVGPLCHPALLTCPLSRWEA
jgi:hypothetical protein